MPTEFSHVTVLLDEVVHAIQPRPGGVYVDVTLGGGGHAEAVLRASEPDGIVIGIDQDPAARAHASERLKTFGPRARIVAGRMSEVKQIVADQGFAHVDGLIADLGVSSPQLDDATRGLSFRAEGPLDMRMNPDAPTTAFDLVRALTERELADVIYQYGDERASRPIARSIKRFIEQSAMNTTTDLAKAVYRVLGPPRHGRGIDPATRTFQALRIAVNQELDELDALLRSLADVLADGGRAAIISFHSLEDRAVKHGFRENEALIVETKKPIEPSEAEQAANSRARSAKLRVARRAPREQEFESP